MEKRESALKVYGKAKQLAYKAYMKTKELAYEDYRKAILPTAEAYRKAEQSAWEAYLKVMLPVEEAYGKANQLEGREGEELSPLDVKGMLKEIEEDSLNDSRTKEEFRREMKETKGVVIYTLPSGKLQSRRYNPSRVRRAK